MKLINKDLLFECGFTENINKAYGNAEVMTKGKFEIILKNGVYCYVNQGIDYPLRDLAALRKLYKEIYNEELKPK